jgi:biopolymer transport protein ExbD
MRFRHTQQRDEPIELQMTPMIDIVFQLIAFFIMSFKIVLPEGDFNVKMPLVAPRETASEELSLPPIKVRVTAKENGEPAGLQLNDQPLENFHALRQRIIGLIGDDTGPGSMAESAEVEFDFDYDLKYKYNIEAISAVSGYITPEGKFVTLIEKIKFAPPRAPKSAGS